MSGKPKSPAETEISDGDAEHMPVVCPRCFTRNPLRQHFCRKCGTPLTNLAVTDPLGQVFSEGDTYRKAIDNPDKPIVLIGMWLLFGPTFFICASLMVWFIVGAFTGPLGPIDAMGVVAMIVFPVLFGGMSVISGVILFRTTRNFRRRRSQSNDDGDGDMP